MEDSLRTLQRKMIGHAMLMILMTLVAGIGLWMSLQRGFEIIPGTGTTEFWVPGHPDGWARMHRGCAMNGFMVLGVAWALGILRLPESRQKFFGWSMIAAGWGNTAFYFFSIFSPNRGLSFGANHMGPGTLWSFLALAPAYVVGILSIVVMILIAKDALGTQRA